jgi:hypothetical protein
MRAQRLAPLALLVAFAFLTSPFTPAASAQVASDFTFSTKNPVCAPSGCGDNPGDAYVIDEDSWVVLSCSSESGTPGIRFYRTDDGGTTWARTVIASGSSPLFWSACDVIARNGDDLTATACRRDASSVTRTVAYTTTDGGTTWSSEIVVSSGACAGTSETPGGGFWDPAEQREYVCWVGVAVGGTVTFAISTSHGTWGAQAGISPAATTTAGYCETHGVGAFLVVAYCTSSGITFITSSNSGATWGSPIVTGFSALTCTGAANGWGLRVVSSSKWFVVAMESSIEALWYVSTTNGGLAFTRTKIADIAATEAIDYARGHSASSTVYMAYWQECTATCSTTQRVKWALSVDGGTTWTNATVTTYTGNANNGRLGFIDFAGRNVPLVFTAGDYTTTTSLHVHYATSGPNLLGEDPRTAFCPAINGVNWGYNFREGVSLTTDTPSEGVDVYFEASAQADNFDYLGLRMDGEATSLTMPASVRANLGSPVFFVTVSFMDIAVNSEAKFSEGRDEGAAFNSVQFEVRRNGDEWDLRFRQVINGSLSTVTGPVTITQDPGDWSDFEFDVNTRTGHANISESGTLHVASNLPTEFDNGNGIESVWWVWSGASSISDADLFAAFPTYRDALPLSMCVIDNSGEFSSRGPGGVTDDPDEQGPGPGEPGGPLQDPTLPGVDFDEIAPQIGWTSQALSFFMGLICIVIGTVSFFFAFNQSAMLGAVGGAFGVGFGYVLGFIPLWFVVMCALAAGAIIIGWARSRVSGGGGESG